MPDAAGPIDLDFARNTLRQEAAAVARLAEELGAAFRQACRSIYDCQGAVVVSGVGKAGIVGQKISATLASTGTPSHFLHPSEAIHGDLGRLRAPDVVLVLSHSGASEEIVRLLGLLKQLGMTIIGITSGMDSPLARHSDITIGLGQLAEVCPLGLAPSTSTTCMMALGDALALTVMRMRNFQAEDYARFHPGGALGRKLVTVEQAALFSPGKALPTASDALTVAGALEEAEAKVDMRHGCILLVDQAGCLSGLLTDGDLRRALRAQKAGLMDRPVAEIMTARPTTVRPDTLAGEAMAILHQRRIDELPVVDDHGRPVGLIDVQDVVALRVLQ